jgi:hypothetical protein
MAQSKQVAVRFHPMIGRNSSNFLASPTTPSSTSFALTLFECSGFFPR